MPRADRYNYRRFQPEAYAFDAFEGPEPGEPFPAFEAYTPEGEPVTRADLVGRPVVLETGSISCPVYTDRIERMRRLRDTFPDVAFVVLYVREAHPGTHIGPHTTPEEKRKRARQLRLAEGEDRRVIVDEPGGSLHRAIGAFPNSVHVLDAQGTVVYRAEWSDPGAIEQVLLALTKGQPVPFVVPDPGTPPVGLREAVRVTWRAGTDAFLDLVKAIPALLGKRRALDQRWRERAEQQAPVEPPGSDR